jgi:hypothetical protein
VLISGSWNSVLLDTGRTDPGVVPTQWKDIPKSDRFTAKGCLVGHAVRVFVAVNQMDNAVHICFLGLCVATLPNA